MNIAIIGTGLSGLSTGWFLLNHFEKIHVTFFDSEGIGGGASGIAAGLLHPFAGASAKLNRQGFEGYLATCKLLKIAEEKLGQAVINCRGLLRLATTERQKGEYFLSSEKYEDVIWFEADAMERKIPGVASYPGIYIPNSLGVDCHLYLEGLWKACEERGAQFVRKKIFALEEIKEFDQIVLATGAFANQLTKEKLPITAVKGQMIELQWPTDLPPLPMALNSYAYLVMNKEKMTCLAGATYERDFVSSEIDVNVAKNDILPKITTLIPALKDQPILDCKAGVRASTPDHLPIIKQIDNKCWVITGMGSKGLLYHALYGEKLAQLIVASRLTTI